ncbi:MAG: hypothetical protein V7K53_18860 [Nostoc sp.]|uniref:hypothetical protein n=1 Tax=Nostoc sp. TaxID=1180 RepID=UPI002FFB4DEE
MGFGEGGWEGEVCRTHVQLDAPVHELPNTQYNHKFEAIAVIKLTFTCKISFIVHASVCYAITSACYAITSVCYAIASVCYAITSVCYAIASVCYAIASVCYAIASVCYAITSVCYAITSACYAITSACYAIASACKTEIIFSLTLPDLKTLPDGY